MPSNFSITLARSERIVASTHWPPDLFAALVDALAIDRVWQSVQSKFISPDRSPVALSDEEAQLRAEVAHVKANKTEWKVSTRFIEMASAALTSLRAAIVSDPVRIDEIERAARRITFLARAIDAEALELSLENGSLTADKFQIALDLFSSRGTFTKLATGKVIPGAARSTYGNAPDKFFSNLLRVDSKSCAYVDYTPIPTIRRKSASSPISIGFVPAVLNRDELKWGKKNGFFTVRLNSKKESRVINRTIEALDWLSSMHADVVIIPELVSSTRLRRCVSEWLRYRAANPPMLVICGSEAVRSASSTGYTNRAFVLGSSGRELWTQDKHHQYWLTEQDILRYKLQRYVGRKMLNEIGASVETRVAVRDFRGFGRVCLLVCEDFNRSIPGPSTIRTFGVDMAIVIVMDKKFDPEGWRKTAAVSCANDVGTRVAIANSRGLVSRQDVDPLWPESAPDLAYMCFPIRQDPPVEIWPKGALSKCKALLIAPSSKL